MTKISLHMTMQDLANLLSDTESKQNDNCTERQIAEYKLS